MSTETFTQKGLVNAGLLGPQNYYYQHQQQQQQHHHPHHHLYNPAPRLSALASPHLSAARVQAKHARSASRRSVAVTSTRQQRRASQQLQPQPLHPLTTLLAVVFDFFLRGVLDLTWPIREVVKMVVRGVVASLSWAYYALPLPLALGLLYCGFQSVPEALRSVEELRAVYGTSVVGDVSGVEGIYALGELALVRWGDLGVSSAFYCLAMMTAAYAVMLLIEMRDYVRDTWALIRDEALEVKALWADESS
ncbi:hypothetical protein C8034_v007059 [Colletotrichum sidae]|nr:hypothetical protein C8034_v007059 [Colletotrichum sidae]